MFSQLEHLRQLFIDHNNLHTIHDRAFYATHSLEILHLHFNRLTMRSDHKFPTILGKQQNETQIYIAPFLNLDKLKVLHLQNNLIESVFSDEWSLSLLKLEELDLSYNHITFLSAGDLQFLAERITVNLSHNQITTIELDNIDIIAENISKSSPPKILLGSNPLNCNCRILTLVQMIKDRSKISGFVDLDVSELMCSKPLRYRGKHVSTMEPYDLLCDLDDPNTQKKRCPENCDCKVRLVDHAMIVNCSNQGLTDVPKLPSLNNTVMKHIEVDLSNNYISRLPSIMADGGYKNISQLLLNNNNLSFLIPDNIPRHLKVLKLDSNGLEWINTSVLDTLNKTNSLQKLSLSNNPWMCNCESIEFLTFVQSQYKKINDFNSIQCSNGQEISKITASDLCQEDNLAVILFAIIIALLGILVALTALLYLKYNQEIKVWLFSKGWCMWLIDEDDLDEDKKYDAFISFSQRDEELVAEHLVPELESGDFPYKLCIHFRDWIVGDVISDQVINTFEVLDLKFSDNFLY